MASDEYCGKPYKIIDSKREHKIGIVASSLADFMTKGKHLVMACKLIKCIFKNTVLYE